MDMDYLYLLFSVLVFIAVALGVESVWQWWFSNQSKAARRFSQRMRAMDEGSNGVVGKVSLMKRRQFAEGQRLDTILRAIPVMHWLDIRLQQAGSQWSVGRLLGACGIAFGAVQLVAMVMGAGMLLSVVLASAAGAAPVAWVMRQRARRLQRMQVQLPEAADLIARSLRAGHALQSTLQMVADELPDPIAVEFRIVSDEINYGLGMQAALQRLAERVPIDDLRFMVISVLIQRETGGNLAELMGKLSMLVRDRLKLHGTIRVLSAEGRLSGWILFLLPIIVGGIIALINPSYLGFLIDDPAGIDIMLTAFFMQAAGGFWMRKLVRIRV